MSAGWIVVVCAAAGGKVRGAQSELRVAMLKRGLGGGRQIPRSKLSVDALWVGDKTEVRATRLEVRKEFDWRSRLVGTPQGTLAARCNARG